jgi:hypothetical protein
MSTTFEISTKNYINDRLAIKMALSHIETLVGVINGYSLSDPYEKFGWTFFKTKLNSDLQYGIEKKFSDMIEKYQCSPVEKFTKFMTDYFANKGCNVLIKPVSV